MALLLWGCSAHPSGESSDPQCRIVTKVTVTYEDSSTTAHMLYTNAQKMQSILNYLRLIDPYGTPQENPDYVEGSTFRIVLSYSDGCEKSYLQKADQFMKVDGGQWKRIDPERAAELGPLLGRMESDKQI